MNNWHIRLAESEIPSSEQLDWLTSFIQDNQDSTG